MSYDPVEDGVAWEWELTNVDEPSGVDIACCDCGLVHRLLLYPGRTARHVDIVFETLHRETAARRRVAMIKSSIARLYGKMVSK